MCGGGVAVSWRNVGVAAAAAAVVVVVGCWGGFTVSDGLWVAIRVAVAVL